MRKLFISIGFIAVLASAYLSFGYVRNAGIKDLQREAEGRLAATSAAVFAPTDKYSYLPRILENYRTVKQLLRHPHDRKRVEAVNLLLQRLNGQAGSSVLYVMNLQGTTLASSNWQEEKSFVGQNYAFRPYFVEAVNKGIGTFYGTGVTSKVAGYYVSHLVLDGDVPLGVVTAKIDIRSLHLGWEEIEHHAVVTDDNGIIFLSSREEWHYRPMWPLSSSALRKVRETRQYERVLRQPLSLRLQEDLGAEQAVVKIDGTSYFLKSGRVPSSDWKIHLLTPMRPIDAAAWQAALTAAVLISFLGLALLYLEQIRARNRERRASQQALEQAHQVLQQKHSDLQKLSEEFRIASITDALTGTFNRRFFLESAAKMVSAAKRHGSPLSLILIDVDHFKRINDVYGHDAGDAVLQALTAAYREELREEDLFARFGGEEFVLALPNTDAIAAQAVAERLRLKIMNERVLVHGEHLRITVSSGIGEYRPDEPAIDAALKRADENLYRAKAAGRNQVVCV